MMHAVFEYEHPLLTAAAIRAQAELDQIQGIGGVWFCGSYFGYGFHEDALQSGIEVAETLGAQRPWHTGKLIRETQNDSETLIFEVAGA